MPARADTLSDALVSSFETNPVITAQRRVVQSSEAAVAAARAARRPQISANVGAQRELTRSGVFDLNEVGRNSISAGLSLDYPLFTGGRVRGALQAEKSRLRAAQEILRAVEGDVFTEVATAYADVLRDHAIVDLQENQVRVLATNLRSTQANYDSGDLTRTDIAQSQARLSLAESQLSLARAQLAASAEDYLRLVGRPPRELTTPQVPASLPASADAAVRLALVQNPDLVAISHQARAAEMDVRVARAARLPTLGGFATADYVRRSTGFDSLALQRSGAQSSVGVDLRIPLYQGGGPSAQIRRAQAVEGETLERRVATERAVIANTRAQFAAYEAGKSAVLASEVAVAANELALEGARIERKLGFRTVLEELNAEQELLGSQVQLLSAHRDVHVAAYRLLNSMGKANATELGLITQRRAGAASDWRFAVRTWSDWADEPRHTPRATSTASISAIDLSAAGMSQMIAPQSAFATKVKPTLVSRLAKVRRPLQPAQLPPSTQGESKAAQSPQSSASPGSWQIQLGAFRVQGSAQAFFEKVSRHVPGKQPVFSQFRGLTRLRVGSYGTKSQAESACRALVALGYGCIPVLNRTPDLASDSKR